MKYLTKEWYNAMQRCSGENYYKEIPDKVYSDSEIEKFCHERFTSGDCSEENYAYFLKNCADFEPKWLTESVDPRLVALGLLPTSAYKRLIKEIAEAKEIYLAAEKGYTENVDSRLADSIMGTDFSFHDSEISDLSLPGNDCVMNLSYGNDSCKITFTDATVTEDEISSENRPLKLLDFELYKIPEGYNMHMLFDVDFKKRCYFTVNCSDIVLEISLQPADYNIP